MNSRHRKTLAALYERPERADIAWREIEALLLAIGAELSEGSGSRIRVALNGVPSFIGPIRRRKRIKVQ